MANKLLFALLIQIVLIKATASSLQEANSCNPTTAPCTKGICCSECRFRLAGVPCRAAKGECDVPEVCSGFSDECPGTDVFVEDGRSCGDGWGVCFQGECVSKASRMQSTLDGNKTRFNRDKTRGGASRKGMLRTALKENSPNDEGSDIENLTKKLRTKTSEERNELDKNLRHERSHSGEQLKENHSANRNLARTVLLEKVSVRRKEDVLVSRPTPERTLKNHSTEKHSGKKKPQSSHHRSASRASQSKANTIDRWLATNRNEPLFIALCVTGGCLVAMTVAFVAVCFMYRRERSRRVKIATRVHKNLRSLKNAHSQVSKIEGANVDVGGY